MRPRSGHDARYAAAIRHIHEEQAYSQGDASPATPSSWLSRPRVGPGCAFPGAGEAVTTVESAASTFARVSHGAVRVDVGDPFARAAARVRVRARVGLVEVTFRTGRLAAGLDLAGSGSEAARSRGSSAASA
jgi:hypothetical protein